LGRTENRFVLFDCQGSINLVNLVDRKERGMGIPPAKEMISGLTAVLSSSRMADERIAFTLAEKSTMFNLPKNYQNILSCFNRIQQSVHPTLLSLKQASHLLDWLGFSSRIPDGCVFRCAVARRFRIFHLLLY
jgi:hypothetical protein